MIAVAAGKSARATSVRVYYVFGVFPFRKACRFSTAVFIRRERASFVAQAMCGVRMQFCIHQRRSVARRLYRKHIESRSTQFLLVEGVGEILLDNQRASSRVDGTHSAS